MFDDATIAATIPVAKKLGVDPAALLGIAEIESGGKAFAAVDGHSEPLIRFEGHYFDRRLPPDQRKKARKLGLSAPMAGGVKNPASQAGRWRLLDRAAAINRQAAYESVSWGLGQVMGAHWAWLGYSSVDAMVAAAREGAAGQIDVMARYIDKAGLVSAIKKGDWTAFARGYNGPAYRANKYDTKIAAAVERWRKRLATWKPAAPMPTPIERAPATQKPASAQKPVPAPEHPGSAKTAPTVTQGGKAGIAALVAAAVLALGAWLANLPCNLLGVLCQ